MTVAAETPDTAQAQAALAEQRIAELARENAALRASADLLESIVESSRDGIVLVDEQGLIVEWNRGEEEISGLRRAEVLGRPLWEVLLQAMPEEHRRPAACERIRTGILETLRSGRPPVHEWSEAHRLRRADGSRRTLPAMVFPIRSERGLMLGPINRDTSERRRGEEAPRFLGEAGSALASSLDYEATLKRAAHLAVPILADWWVCCLARVKRASVGHGAPSGGACRGGSGTAPGCRSGRHAAVAGGW